MRGSVGVVLGASGDWACLTAMGLLWRPTRRLPAAEARSLHQKSPDFVSFTCSGVTWGASRAPVPAGAGAPGVAGLAACGSGLQPSMLNFSILAPARSWSRICVTVSRASSSRIWSDSSSKVGGGAWRRSSSLMTW